MAVKWLTTFALLWAVGAHAAGYPTESQFRMALGDIDAVVRAEGMALEVLDAEQEGVTLPLLSAGLNIDTNTCVVFFNTLPEDGLVQFFSAINEHELALMLRAISVHEVTHCVEQREAYVLKRFDKVLPDAYKQDGMSIQGYLSVVKSGAVETWGEALADISSVLYLKQTVPGQWLALATRISAMRRELGTKWPTHDTSDWLDRLIELNPDIDGRSSVFDAAFLYRKEFSR